MMRPAPFQSLAAFALLAAAAAGPALAQAPAAAPGTRDLSRVTAGTYKVDPAHTQVLWEVDHLGISPLHGAFGNPSGTLTLDPRNPSAAKLSLTLPLTGLMVTSSDFLKHLNSADFFDVAKHPTATFTSTSVRLDDDPGEATVTGNLTIKGITRPVTLDVDFYGAGENSMSKKLNIGFTAETKIRRSDFGLGMAVPAVSDEVDLEIVAAFEKQ
jgi:polyisoprenoid-binding protein YceI